jgi:hypothetical protein
VAALPPGSALVYLTPDLRGGRLSGFLVEQVLARESVSTGRARRLLCIVVCRWAMTGKSNERSGVDAGGAFCLHILRCWPGATHRERWA